MLVSYSDSEDENPVAPVHTSNPVDHAKLPSITGPAISKKRKALPVLPQSYSHDNPRDDPSQHQGRKRSRPYTEGDYNMHVFASVKPPEALRKILQSVIAAAQKRTPHSIHSFLDDDADLHVSLTHPHPLRQSQMSQVRAELTDIVSRHKPFRLSFAGRVSGYVNGKKYGGEGEGGRAFLAVRLAAGSMDVERIVEDIHPVLDRLHLQRYHDNPEFHASFAWCLAYGDTPFTPAVLEALSQEFGEDMLKQQPKGGWKVDQLAIKIGKDIFAMPLATTE